MTLDLEAIKFLVQPIRGPKIKVVRSKKLLIKKLHLCTRTNISKDEQNWLIFEGFVAIFWPMRKYFCKFCLCNRPSRRKIPFSSYENIMASRSKVMRSLKLIFWLNVLGY